MERLDSRSRSSLEVKLMDLSVKGEWEISFDEMHVQEEIGTGTYSTVRYGTWRGTPVALKLIKDDDVNITELYKEMYILSKLHHPNILQIIGCSAKEPPLCLVLEYMPRGSLQSYVGHTSANKLTKEEKNRIVKDVSRGLAYLHYRKPDSIIHRDLKPSNILLTQSKSAKIADYGISCILSGGSKPKEMTGETGTYRYMAPEVLKSEKNYDYKVDIWSFGMLVYAIYEDVPYKYQSMEEFMKQITSEHPTSKLKLDRLESCITKLIVNTVQSDVKKRWDTIYLVQYCNVELHCRSSNRNDRAYCCGIFTQKHLH